jgi:hypothetical protein
MSAAPQNELEAVDAVSATDAWAVGSAGDRTLYEHWDGAGWTAVNGPSLPLGRLTSVSAASSQDVWALGGDLGRKGWGRTLMAHWDGSRWSTVSTPSPGGKDESLLDGLSALSVDDAWAVGNYNAGHYRSDTLVEHWDGSTWTQVPSPSPGRRFGSSLTSVDAVSASDVWAVGASGGPGDDESDTLIEHWDGTRWTRVPSPDPVQNNQLLGITATSPTDAWAVGYDLGQSGIETLVEHWNGTRWSVVGGHAVALGQLDGVSSSGPHDIWAVGESDARVDKTVILHGDGSTWQRVASPDPGGTLGSGLSGVSSVSPTSSVAVGSFSTSKKTYDVLTAHWNGSGWSQP